MEQRLHIALLPGPLHNGDVYKRQEVRDALNIPRYEQEGWEADDLIGTISRKCEADGWDCVVVTGDKDKMCIRDRYPGRSPRRSGPLPGSAPERTA